MYYNDEHTFWEKETHLEPEWFPSKAATCFPGDLCYYRDYRVGVEPQVVPSVKHVVVNEPLAAKLFEKCNHTSN